MYIFFLLFLGIALVFVNYAVKANEESEDSLLLPCIESVMQIIRIVSSHFDAKKEDFFKALDLENSDTRFAMAFFTLLTFTFFIEYFN